MTAISRRPHARTPRFLVRVALLAAMTLAAPAVAGAAIPLTFDGLATGTGLSTQFAADGIVFTSAGITTPLVADVGARASSGTKVAMSQCFGCEFQHHAIRGLLTRSRETFTVRAGIDSPVLQTVGVVLEALDTNGFVIKATPATLDSANFRQTLTVDGPGTDDIFQFRLRTTDTAGAPIGIDDVTYTGGGTAAPDISVSVANPDLRLLAGNALDVPVTVSRFNDSSGDVTMDAVGLPGGVTATFTPAVLPGTTTATTMHLAASAGAGTSPLPFPLTIQATPAGALIGPAPRSVVANLVVDRPFTVALPTGPIAVPSCGSTTVSLRVDRAQGFAATIGLAIDPLPAGYSASLGATSLPLPGDGSRSTTVPLTVSFTGTGSLLPTAINVVATSGTSPAATANRQVTRVAARISAVAPGIGKAPQALALGDSVTITGGGFCAGAAIRFGNSSAEVTVTPVMVAPGGGSVTVRVPRLATTGPVSVQNADGGVSSATPFTVVTFRGTGGYAFGNYTHPGVSLDDLRAVYGASQTNITIDACWPFGCNIVTPIPSPFAYAYELISNQLLDSNASCFGISLTSQRLREGWVPYSRFAPAGATNPWQLADAAAPSSALATDVRRWHQTQLSSEFIQHWVATAATNLANGGANTRGTIVDGLLNGHRPLIVLRDTVSDGHVVVAYDVRADTTPGAYLIDVYDPNVPFTAEETTSPNAHVSRMEASVIHVRADGHWSHVGAYGRTWSGGPGTIVVVPWGTVPRTPTLPSTLSGLVSLIVPFASGTAPTQVVDAAGHTLLDAQGQPNENLATRIPGADVLPSLSGLKGRPISVVPVTGSYTASLPGTGSGTTGLGIIAPGFSATVRGVRTAPGVTNRVKVDATAGGLAVDAARGGELKATLARTANGNAYGADLTVRGGDRGSHAFTLAGGGGAASYRNGGGAARVSIRLRGGSSKGVTGVVDLGTVSVPAGGTLSVVPSAWANVATQGGRVTVRSAGGRVLVSRTLRPKAAAKRIRSIKVSARTASGNSRIVTVRVRFTKAPRGSRVIVAAHVLRGRLVVATSSRTISAAKARGVRSVSFRMKLTDATYSVTGSAVIVSAGTSARVERLTRKLRFRAR